MHTNNWCYALVAGRTLTAAVSEVTSDTPGAPEVTSGAAENLFGIRMSLRSILMHTKGSDCLALFVRPQ
jgi:hypothetical protein